MDNVSKRGMETVNWKPTKKSLNTPVVVENSMLSARSVVVVKINAQEEEPVSLIYLCFIFLRPNQGLFYNYVKNKIT